MTSPNPLPISPSFLSISYRSMATSTHCHDHQSDSPSRTYCRCVGDGSTREGLDGVHGWPPRPARRMDEPRRRIPVPPRLLADSPRHLWHNVRRVAPPLPRTCCLLCRHLG